jgi:endonuclease YncB( thermonuclease family)
MPRVLFATIATASAALILAVPAPAQEPCRLADIGTATASAVRDGRTLALADGRELRLAGIEVPDRARAELQSLVVGRNLHLHKADAQQDRYGRLLAFVFVGDAHQSLQQTLLEQGNARVSARVGDQACADALLAAERTARAGRRELWADPNFAPLPAEDSGRLRGQRGHFVIVEGKVLSVRESGGTLYVNFGRRWTRDFSVVVPRRLQGAFAAAGLDLKQLGGRHVRVRGWLEGRRGPIIEADAPEQIEIVDNSKMQAQEARP